jgi:DNA repair protein RecO
MNYFKDVAITLKVTPFQERHKIVTALTENHGKITVLAKNSVQSRRFGGALELFTASEWYFSERENPNQEDSLCFLKEAHVRTGFPGLRLDLDRLGLGSFFCEVLLRVAPSHLPHPDLFKLLANSLSVLETQDFEKNIQMKTINVFLLKVLQWSGHQPQFNQCFQCSKSVVEVLGTSSKDQSGKVLALIPDAGWLCPDCRGQTSRQSSVSLRERIELHPAQLLNCSEILGYPTRKSIEMIQGSHQDQMELFEFLKALLVYHLPGFDQISLKSLKFLDFLGAQPNRQSP